MGEEVTLGDRLVLGCDPGLKRQAALAWILVLKPNAVWLWEVNESRPLCVELL